MSENVSLQFCRHTDYDCEIVDFEVPKDWLKSKLDEPLETFLDTYTSDESGVIYSFAMLENKIMRCEVQR